MNGAKIQHEIPKSRRPLPSRSDVFIGPWAYIALGLVAMLVGISASSGDGSDELGLVLVVVGTIPLAIGVIAQGVRVGIGR